MRVVIIAMLLSSFGPTLDGQSFSVNPTRVLLLPTGTAKLSYTGAAVGDVTVRVAPLGAIASFDPSTATVTALGAGTTSIALRRNGDADDVLVPIDVLSDVAVSGAERPLVHGETREVVVQPVDSTGLPITGVVIELRPLNAALLSTTGLKLEARVTSERGAKSSDVAILLNGIDSKKRFTVTTLEPIKEIIVQSALALQEGDVTDLDAQLNGVNGGVYKPSERPLRIDPNQFVEMIENGKIRAKEVPNVTSAQTAQATVTIRSKEGTGGTDITKTAAVNVQLRGGFIAFEPSTGILPVGGVTTFRARIKDRLGSEKPTQPITWTLQQQDNKDFVALAPTNDSITVLWRGATEARERERPELIEIVATSPAAGTNVVGSLFVRMPGRVIDFSPLRVSLSIVDEQLATDLYGKKTAQEFHVARVRLNNNLKNDPTGQSAGGSILAFSDSIEVFVGLDKRPIDGKKNTQWQALTIEDMRRFGARGMPTVTERSKSDYRVAPLSAASLMLALKEQRAQEGPTTCEGFISYRPYTFEMIVNSVDRRDERSTRGRAFRALAGLGTVVSFVTSVAVPGPGSDLPLALEKYSNLLIPGMEKIFPSLRESHRQNIVSQIMKPIEEVPFGSDVSRVLFFPKSSFRGLLRDNEVRISEICPYAFQIEVAVIKKGGKVTVQGATPE
jgi:hypothetical protein